MRTPRYQEFSFRQVARRLAGLAALALPVMLFPVSVMSDTWRVMDDINLNARTGPGTEHPVVETLPARTIVEELDRDGNWSRVRTSHDTIVYVQNKFLSVLDIAGEEMDHSNVHIIPQLGHADSINYVTFSPDGKQFATASSDGSVRLWDTESGRLLRLLQGSSNARVLVVEFSPDGRTVATGSTDGNARIWDAETGRELFVLPDAFDYEFEFYNIFEELFIANIEFSPDGHTIATGMNNCLGSFTSGNAGYPEGTQEFWDATTGENLFVESEREQDSLTVVVRTSNGIDIQIQFESGIVDCVVISPDGRSLATATEHGIVRIFDVETGQELHTLIDANEHSPISGIAFSPDSRMVAVAGSHSVEVWDARTGTYLYNLDAGIEGLTNMEFSPDGRTVAIGDEGGSARLWSVDTGRLLHDLPGHSNGKVVVTFSPDSHTVLTGSDDGVARLWDVKSGLEIYKTPSEILASIELVSVSPDGNTIAIGSNVTSGDDLSGFPIQLWDVGLGRPQQRSDGRNITFDSGKDFRITPDGLPEVDNTIIGTAYDGHRNFIKWYRPYDEELSMIPNLEKFSEGYYASEVAPRFAFGPDGEQFVWVAYDGSVGVGEIATGGYTLMEGATSEEGLWRVSYDVEFSGDGSLLAGWIGSYPLSKTWDVSHEVSIWDTTTGQRLQLLEGHGVRFWSAVFSPDNRIVATGSVDGSVRLWEVATGIELHVLKGHSGRVNSLGFDLDGGRLLVGSEGGTARLWDVSTGGEIASFVSFSDGSWATLASNGFFHASEGAAKKLNLVRGLEVLSIDQAYEVLYRPDLVGETLAGDPVGKVAAALANIDLENVVASGMPPKVISLVSLDGSSVSGDTVEVSTDIRVRSGGVGRVEWRVNGIAQGTGSRGLGPAAHVPVQETVRLTNRLFLVPGENVVSVTVYNEANLVASEPVDIVVTSTWLEVASPKLHVLAVGVNDYFDDQLELRYATSDARAIGRALKRAGRDLYDSVEVTYLVDQDVSAEGLASAFEKLGQEVRPQDVFVFFLAGHGKTVDGRYYFLPRDFRFRNVEHLTRTSVSQDQLQVWLGHVSAQKSVLLLDTCESGSLTMEAVPRGLERKTAIDQLSRAVGRTILTASTDTQPALEGYRQHGLFTYTLLEAFAMADSDGDDEVEINELIGYVDERLPVLSEAVFGYRQVPQYMSRGNVFPLGRTVELVSETGRLIPRTPTHVVIRETRVLGDRDDEASVIDTYVPGVLVRVEESQGEWALIAVDGASVGWVDVSRLASLKSADRIRVESDGASAAVDPGDVPEPGNAPGTVFRDCERCPEMIVVPAGSFEMGSPPHEDRRHESEGPVRQVRIPRPFAVGKFEVTREEFATFVEATGRETGTSCWAWQDDGFKSRSGLGWDRPGYAQSDRHPAVCVSWEDARAYVAWLSAETRKRYRLPSEAEWEYTARARTGGPFHFGSTIAPEQANYDGSYAYGDGRTGSYRKKSVAVGGFAANDFGLHDVHGNVWEWTEDCWHARYGGAPSDGTAWTVGGDCKNRVVRGGSWLNRPWNLRSAKRGGYPDGLRSNIIGIRVARSLDP